MKRAYLFLSGLLLLLAGCSNPNAEYIDKVEQQVKEDALGVEMNYQNIRFQWVDTLYVHEKLSQLEEQYTERLNAILDIEYYVRDNYEQGNIFTKDYLTKERFTQLRNWEREVGHPNQSPYGGMALWVREGYKDYYDFAFDNRNASPWISELCDQIDETDSLLSVYDSLQEGDLELLQNVVWFYQRIDNFESSGSPSDLWDEVDIELTKLQRLELKMDSISNLDPSMAIHYKALNNYTIDNPLLNGAEQELTAYFIFDPQLEIIGKDDYED